MNLRDRISMLESAQQKKLRLFYRESAGMTDAQREQVAQAEAAGIPVRVVCFTRGHDVDVKRTAH